MPTRRRYSVLVNALRISAETPVLALVHIHIFFFIILQTGKDGQTLSCLMTTYMYTTSTSSIDKKSDSSYRNYLLISDHDLLLFSTE